MADISGVQPPSKRWKIDKAVAVIVLIPIVLAVFDPGQIEPTIRFATAAFLNTLPFILFAILAVAYMKATGAENLLSGAFQGREVRMIVLAALVGGLSPFCSCQVIPFIAALLAMGAPLSAVMAFWLSSPLMDPAMFSITAGTLGIGFATAKLGFAVAIGLLGGFTVRAFASSALFSNPLKKAQVKSCCSSSCGEDEDSFSGAVKWKFWGEAHRRASFREAALENLFFLGKWLALAYMIEALMLRYIPAELIAQVLGGTGLGPILLGAIVGAPAYLNGYAAVPLVDALLEQGMSNGAAMAFVIAGGISSIPAAVAVWALVKPRVFAAYLGIAVVGAVLAGISWNAIA
ncbi:Putative two-component membrane permease complex subunit SMU_747c [Aliiroseovarius pelagivivens]|uniref:Two-component membrane permease complex subunit SMU_747c n=1 Tax=Aliiroseovarius pelagivivens TaxID=1639690 RepID=A0A2R8AIJ5_9RHOB|nr:permease [Aliiroseovarius pelagivivens]SPF75709.1 Putative two-component membrane permease complex subunit SMU_747c [Aliiroseovarius pelagivivens]